jgi:hypothetical protein
LWLISKDYLLKGESIEGNVLLTKLATRRNAIRLLVKEIEWTFSHLVITVKIKKSHKTISILHQRHVRGYNIPIHSV